MTPILSPDLLDAIRAATAGVRAVLGDDDDERAILDTVDGLTDAGDALDALIEGALLKAAHAQAEREAARRMTERARRSEDVEAAYRRGILAVMDAMGLRSARRGAATVTVKAGSPSVEITDKAAVPTQLRKPGEPDKSAIRAHLDAGEAVPGARIVWGAPTVSIRSA